MGGWAVMGLSVAACTDQKGYEAMSLAQSGIGRELGREGLLEFTQTHVMAVPVEGS
jgi:acyl-CoA reductase-like NAD-dependent aldehyde dehydrogenase